jgi:hypothetical protein
LVLASLVSPWLRHGAAVDKDDDPQHVGFSTSRQDGAVLFCAI